MRFEFATAGRIVFGCGCAGETPAIAAGLGRRVLVVVGRSASRVTWLVEQLAGRGLACSVRCVAGEPSVDEAADGARAAREDAVDLIVAFGGGSVIDAGKAIAALVTNPGDPLDYLEVVGRGLPLERDPLPVIAVPTTAGTGAEVTRNAVLSVPQTRVKVSLRHQLMLPRAAVVDPELTLGLPPALTASTGLDALTQLVEPYLSLRASPMADLFCLEGIRCVARSLRRAVERGDDVAARTDMSLASLFGGLALANAGLGVVHGLAAPVGGMFDAPHGAVCAALLPHALQTNVRALGERDPAGPALPRVEELARIVSGRSQAGAADLVEWVRKLVSDLGVPPLCEHGVTRREIPEIAARAAQSSSMKANPIALASAELETVLLAAL